MAIQILAARLDQRAEPVYTAYDGDAGFDLPVLGYHVIRPGEFKDLPVGWAMAAPKGHYIRITGRSSAFRRGLFVVEGIIDEGYRGPLFVGARNETDMVKLISHGDRVGQAILTKTIKHTMRFVDELPGSERGANGFGSSGGHRDQSVYLGFPIDQADDPDRAHRHWNETVMPAYCPFCVQRNWPVDGEEAVARNMAALDAADWAVFLMNDLPSFGVPVEIWRAAESKPDHTVIVGHLPDGLFHTVLLELGVHTVETVQDAARLIDA